MRESHDKCKIFTGPFTAFLTVTLTDTARNMKRSPSIPRGSEASIRVRERLVRSPGGHERARDNKGCVYRAQDEEYVTGYEDAVCSVYGHREFISLLLEHMTDLRIKYCSPPRKKIVWHFWGHTQPP